MNWIWAHIELIAAVIGIISTVWTMIVRADKAFKHYLSAEFATKRDLDVGLRVLDRKLDKILIVYNLNEKQFTLLEDDK